LSRVKIIDIVKNLTGKNPIEFFFWLRKESKF